MSSCARMNRLFAADGKCFVLAMDHGFYNVEAFLAGIENMKPLVETLATEGNPDAMLLTPGQAHLLQDIPGPGKPALVLRSDTTNIYGRDCPVMPSEQQDAPTSRGHGGSVPTYLFSTLIDDPVEQALALDAACVVVNLICPAGRGDVHHQCVQNVCALKSACARRGMPLMVEPVALKRRAVGTVPLSGTVPSCRSAAEAPPTGYEVDGATEKVVTLVRQAVELGADVVKVPPTDDVAAYHKVIETASGVPVLILGGGRVTDKEIFERTATLLRQGAKGIVYGRNVTRHPNPPAMCRALMATVHDGAGARKALSIVGGKS